jgi:diguanylate cyclase (GGDEF)-like protein
LISEATAALGRTVGRWGGHLSAWPVPQVTAAATDLRLVSDGREGTMRTWKRTVPPAYLGLGALYAVSLVLSVAAVHGRGLPYETVAELSRIAFGGIGCAAAVRAARGGDITVEDRRGWRAMAVGFALLFLAPPTVLVLRSTGVVRRGDAADVTHLAFVLGLLIALQLFTVAPTTRREHVKLVLDTLIVLVGGSMVLWYTSFGPYLQRHGLSLDVLVTAGLYPMCDLALLFSVARLLLRGTGTTARRSTRPLAAGTLVLFAGDVVHDHLHNHGRIAMHSSWQFICWTTADALLAAAAVGRLRRDTGGAEETRHSVRGNSALPIAAVAVGHVFLLWAAFQEGSFFPWGGLALGSAALSALVLIRQGLVQRETDELAVTDGLTGLANRELFRDTSNRSLARAARSGTHTAVLVIDMNEFKEVNDTLGHKSGDLVLVEFAKLLRECVPASGLAARLGGDEFAVVLPDLGFADQAYQVAGRIAAATGPVVIDGRLVTLACSIGVAVSAPGELTHDQIVHRADLAMYRAKRRGPQTRWAAWQDAFEQEYARRNSTAGQAAA